MEQCIFIVKSYCEMKSYNQVQTKFRTLFPELLPLNKTMIRKMLKRMRGMGHLQTWIKEDWGKELPQEHKKTLKHCHMQALEKKLRKNKCIKK